MKKRIGVKQLAWGALIGAMYAFITYAALPLSSDLIQLRVSEALCILPYFTFSAVPGLFIGCVIGNILCASAIWDVVFGSLATLAAAYLTYLMGRRKINRFLAPLPAVVLNALVIGALFSYVYQIGAPFAVCAAYVGAGQALACYALGMPLFFIIDRLKDKLF